MEAEDDDPSVDWSENILIVIEKLEKKEEERKKKNVDTTDNTEDPLRYVWLPFRR